MSDFSSSEIPNSSDCISRQAAIDEIARWIGYIDEDMILRIQIGLKKVPSAQPEIIRCKDCRHGVDYYHEGDCYCSNPKWELSYFGGSWDFYCADAERREDGCS